MAASGLTLALGQLLQNLLKHLGGIVLTARRGFAFSAHSLNRALDGATAHGVKITVRQFADFIVQLAHGSLLLFKERTIPSVAGKVDRSI